MDRRHGEPMAGISRIARRISLQSLMNPCVVSLLLAWGIPSVGAAQEVGEDSSGLPRPGGLSQGPWRSSSHRHPTERGKGGGRTRATPRDAVRATGPTPAPAPGRDGFEAEVHWPARGQVWREYHLAPYTSLLSSVRRPEQSVVDWIIHETGMEAWHGEEVAVLSATRGRLRVYHHPEMQQRVEQIVQRFLRPVQSQVSIRVEFFVSTDLDWRSGLIHLLRPSATGPEGQQLWFLTPEDAALILEHLAAQGESHGIQPQHILARNGQPATVDVSQAVNFISSLELMSGAYLAYQPILGRIAEGVHLDLTPLWTTDGSAVDLKLKLTSRLVKKLHAAQGTLPLSTGNQIGVVQVPEVAAGQFEQVLRWPTTRVLLLSAGIQPGVFGTKRGVLTRGPAATELLLLLRLDPPVSVRGSLAPSLDRGSSADSP